MVILNDGVIIISDLDLQLKNVFSQKLRSILNQHIQLAEWLPGAYD